MADEETLRKKYAARARTRTPRLNAQLALFRSVLDRHAAEVSKDKKMSGVMQAKLEQDWQTLEPEVVQRDMGFVAGALWAKGWLDLRQYEAAAQRDGSRQPYLYVYELHTRTFGTGWAYEKFLLDYGRGLEKVPGDEAYDFREAELSRRIEFEVIASRQARQLHLRADPS